MTNCFIEINIKNLRIGEVAEFREFLQEYGSVTVEPTLDEYDEYDRLASEQLERVIKRHQGNNSSNKNNDVTDGSRKD